MTIVPPNRSFLDIWRKIARAEEHLDALKASLLALIEGEADTGIKVETNADETEWKAVFNLPGDDRADPMWSIWIGEILYQLRSSLDHIINAIVLAPTKDTSFPLRDSEGSFDHDTTRQLEGIAVGSVDWTVTKLLQPFWINPAAPRDTTPWALNELANLDRHRSLHATELWLTHESRVAFDPPGFGTVDWSMDLPGPIEHGAVIASGRLLRTPEQPEVTVQVLGVPDLVLARISGFRNAGDFDVTALFANGLLEITDFVKVAVLAFEDPIGFLMDGGLPGQSPRP